MVIVDEVWVQFMGLIPLIHAYVGVNMCLIICSTERASNYKEVLVGGLGVCAG